VSAPLPASMWPRFALHGSVWGASISMQWPASACRPGREVGGRYQPRGRGTAGVLLSPALPLPCLPVLGAGKVTGLSRLLKADADGGKVLPDTWLVLARLPAGDIVCCTFPPESQVRACSMVCAALMFGGWLCGVSAKESFLSLPLPVLAPTDAHAPFFGWRC
jgi:hypothetical protein